MGQLCLPVEACTCLLYLTINVSVGSCNLMKVLMFNDVGPDFEIGHPRFRVLGHALRRAGLGQHFFASIAALHPKGTLDLGHPRKIFRCPRYLI
jgi:hypothetical protein